jgi:hypothetical protein
MHLCATPLHIDDECWRSHFHDEHPETPFRSQPKQPPRPRLDIRSGACRHGDRIDTGRTFLGFRKYRCSDCQEELVAPLSRRRKIFYGAFLALSGVACAGMLAVGYIPLPGIIPVLTAYALVRNRDLEAGRLQRDLATPVRRKKR